MANSFLSAQRANDPTPEPRYPLKLYYCEECGLIQLIDVVDKQEMFDDYSFLTATAKTSLAHFDRYADSMTQRLGLKHQDLVLDIGSNDGTLLKSFRQRGAKVLGVEPAKNLATRASDEGIPTLNEYFSPDTVERIGKHKARLVTANNVVSHVNELNNFVECVSMVLDQRGLFTFEVPWVVNVLSHYNFDIIYHEHLSYFGFKPLSDVLEHYDLELVDLEYFPGIHGGTLRGIAAHSGAFPAKKEVINRVILDERTGADWGALELFARQVQSIRARLFSLLHSLKNEGNTIIGYGAPAKSTILLNYCSIDRSLVDFVIDTTPLKQGKFIPGVRIPIVAPDEMRRVSPNYALLLAWNYKEEILQKEQDYLKSGGKFIMPFPDPEIIG